METRVGLETALYCDNTWSNLTEFMDMAELLEASYGANIGIDIQSWPQLLACYHSSSVPVCAETAAAAVE